MFGQVEEVTAAQRRLITLALGQPVIGTVPLQGLASELFAAAFVLDEHRVTIVFQLRAELGAEAALQQQTRPFQVIVPTRDRAGAGAETQGKLADDRVVRHHAGVLLIRGFAQFGEPGLVVAEHQQMTVCRMLMMPGDAVLGAQALDELEVAFPVLRAVLALGTGADMEGKRIGLNAVALEHLSDDLRHGQVLENPLVVAELQVVQRRNQGQVITGQALAGLPHQYVFDTAMKAFAIKTELEKRGLAEQALQIEIRVFADQFHVDRIQGADGLDTVKGEDVEIVTNRGDVQRKMRRIGRLEHTLFLKQRGNEARCPNRPWSVHAKLAGTLTRRGKNECRKNPLITSEISVFQDVLF
ncbi:hypothetical protein D3C87_1372210 [compost metagenome]